jgi:hypothetical protein
MQQASPADKPKILMKENALFFIMLRQAILK